MTKQLHGVSRKLWQIVHVVCAVGWLGVEASVLGLTVIGLTTDDAGTARTAHDAAVLLADTFFPAATLLMLVSGIVLGLRTRWGLVKYYWVAVKLAIGCVLVVAGTVTLESAVRGTAELATAGTLAGGEGASLVGMLSVIAGMTLFATVLSVVKPWGRIPWRTRTSQAMES